MPAPALDQPGSSIACFTCAYTLDGIDLTGQCPECGTNIITSCVWCAYDLSGTAPDAPCPECGVPVMSSIGADALGGASLGALRKAHLGFRIVTYAILAYIVMILASVLGIGSSVAIVSFGSGFSYWGTVGFAAVVNGLVLLFCSGWYLMSVPIGGLPEALRGDDRRRFLRVALVVFTFGSALYLVYAVGSTLLWGLDGDEPDPIALGAVILSLVNLLVFIVLYYAQLRSLTWWAILLHNRKMRRRSRHMAWSGPLIAVLGLLILFIGPLIVLVMYWNLIEYIRRDLKKAIKRRAASGRTKEDAGASLG